MFQVTFKYYSQIIRKMSQESSLKGDLKSYWNNGFSKLRKDISTDNTFWMKDSVGVTIENSLWGKCTIQANEY